MIHRPLAILLLATMPLAGCGYKSQGLFRTDARSVHVAIFESREFRRDLEFMLTEAVKKRINTDTPFRLASRDRADTILKGEILEERQAAFAADFLTRIPRDRQLTLVVRLEWTDLRTGDVLLEGPLLQAVDYLPPAGETETFAQQKAIDRLAARIVSQMYDDQW
jgi:hypothetical protein